jgi:hypothetical protein
MRALAGAPPREGDGDDALDERRRADLARRGLTLETWAAQMEARARAVLADDRRAPAGCGPSR